MFASFASAGLQAAATTLKIARGAAISAVAAVTLLVADMDYLYMRPTTMPEQAQPVVAAVAVAIEESPEAKRSRLRRERENEAMALALGLPAYALAGSGGHCLTPRASGRRPFEFPTF